MKAKLYIALKVAFLLVGLVCLISFGIIFVLISAWYKER